MSPRLYIGIITQFFLIACSQHYIKQTQNFNHIPVKESTSSSITNDSISPYKLKIETATSRVIAVCEGNLTMDGDETALGNFACDALRFGAGLKLPDQKINVVLMNRRGLRTTIASGEIKVGNIFEVMPFENEVVMIKLSGENLLKFMPLLVESKHSFWGLRIKMKDKNDISVRMIDGEEIKNDRIYTVITSDYLANGGDNFSFLKNGERTDLGLLVRDAMISYCESVTAANKKITPYLDGRFEVSK